MYIGRVAVSEPRYAPAPNSAPPWQTVRAVRAVRRLVRCWWSAPTC
ncbi:hypothetical protein [Kitasatospora sp. SolWspMP-SS2h]|nr:hypothetical protein [Kitasatospora sp. SolWspMP-SS2h]